MIFSILNSVSIQNARYFHSKFSISDNNTISSISKSSCIEHCKDYLFGSLPSVNDFDKLKNMDVEKGVCATAQNGKSKAGRLKNVCRKAKFFTNGYFDFEDKTWKSEGQIIDRSRWYTSDPKENELKKYPVLFDRFAYFKRSSTPYGVQEWVFQN